MDTEGNPFCYLCFIILILNDFTEFSCYTCSLYLALPVMPQAIVVRVVLNRNIYWPLRRMTIVTNLRPNSPFFAYDAQLHERM